MTPLPAAADATGWDALCDDEAALAPGVDALLARHGLQLPAFFVVSRTGWHEALSGRTRRWNRVRTRGPRTAVGSGPEPVLDRP